MQISYTLGQVTRVWSTCNHPEVGANYIKYLLKNTVDKVDANGKTITLKGSRVYIDGKVSTWGVLALELGEQ